MITETHSALAVERPEKKHFVPGKVSGGTTARGARRIPVPLLSRDPG